MTQDEKLKLWELIKPLEVGMLVTQHHQELHARPMHLVQSDFDGLLYFFTNKDCLKADEIDENPDVCVAFSQPKAQTYVSVSGTAAICKDQLLIDQFWNPFVAAWFPQGKEDPSVVLIKIKLYSAEYWNATSNTLVQLFAYAKALFIKEPPNMGEHGKLTPE